MKELHKEWFPIDYPQEFFDRIRKKSVISIGCFYNVEICEATESSPGMVQSVLIGIVYSKIETENAKNEVLLSRIDDSRWSQQSWSQRIREIFSCGQTIHSNRQACYIMTIGVIDECRKMGLGTKLLNHTIGLLEQ